MSDKLNEKKIAQEQAVQVDDSSLSNVSGGRIDPNVYPCPHCGKPVEGPAGTCSHCGKKYLLS